MNKTLDIQAHSEREAIAIVRELHPVGAIDAWRTDDGYDVLVWDVIVDDDDVLKAKDIARYTLPA